jgi:MFS family permease
LAVQQPVPSLLVLLAGRLVLGAGESLLITGVLSWAIMRAGASRAGRAMAWNGMAQYGALALGAPAGQRRASALRPDVPAILVAPFPVAKYNLRNENVR